MTKPIKQGGKGGYSFDDWADFILSLLSNQRQEIIKEVEKMVDRETDPMFGTVDCKSLGERILNWLAHLKGEQS